MGNLYYFIMAILCRKEKNFYYITNGITLTQKITYEFLDMDDLFS